MKPRLQLRSYYWRENHLLGNLGDALVPLLLQALGYAPVALRTGGAPVGNEQRGLLVIGSLLTETDLAALNHPVDVWGCGWKGHPLSPARQAQLTVHAVRGPLTITGLGLPPDTPLGDPALLLPHLHPRAIRQHGSTVVVPHFHRTRLLPVVQRCGQSGCTTVVSTQVWQWQGLGRPGWVAEWRTLLKNWLHWGMTIRTPWSAVAAIAGADFVLSGSLHGAILAQAYGVPWAAYDDGYIDAPAKWQDWAAYLGIPIDFVPTLAAGQRWWQRVGRYGQNRDLAPLLAAFPYPVLATVGQ